MKKKIIISVIILFAFVCISSFVYIIQNKEDKKDVISQLLESDVMDTTEQHIQNMTEQYQLTKTHILYLEGDRDNKTELCYVDRKERTRKPLLENVKCFVELDGKIYYTRLDKTDEIDGGIYCYDIISGEKNTIISCRESVQWFSLYKSSLIFIYKNGVGAFDMKEQRIIKMTDYFPSLPFESVLISDYLLILQETGKIELISLKEKNCYLIMQRDAMSLDRVACIGNNVFIGMNAYTSDGNYNIKKLERNWNGLWRFSLSDWHKNDPEALNKVSDNEISELYAFKNKLYNDNREIEMK
jgi:hypothetical protein